MKASKTITRYELRVWNKDTCRYMLSWTGKSYEQALIMSKRPYNNLRWMGRKQIVKITEEIENK